MSLEPNITNLASINFEAQPINVHLKETSEPVLDYWDEQMAQINALLQIPRTQGGGSSDVFGDPSVLGTYNSLANLYALARNGFTLPDGRKDYITVQMAQDLQNLIQTFEGIPGVVISEDVNAMLSGQLTFNQLIQWLDASQSTPTITQIINHMNQARSVGGVWSEDGVYQSQEPNVTNPNAGSLQAMIELIYVKQGNEILASNLEELEKALTINKTALESLTALQNLHNNVVAFSKGQLTAPIAATLNPTVDDANADAYTKDGGSVSQFFDSIKPELGPGLVSLFDLFTTYSGLVKYITNNSTSSFSIDTGGQTISSAISNLQGILLNLRSANDGDGTGWSLVDRTSAVDFLNKYLPAAVSFNNAIERLNVLLNPLLLMIPVQEVLVEDAVTGLVNVPVKYIEVGGVKLMIPLDKLPIPPFTPESLPLPVSVVPIPGFGTQAEAKAFANSTGVTTFFNLVDQDVSDTITPESTIANKYAAVLDNINDLPALSITYSDYAGNAFLSDDRVLYGSGGKSPLAIFDLASQIQTQHKSLSDQKDALANDPEQTGNPNSLRNKIDTVLQDLNNAGYEENVISIQGFAGYSVEDKKIAIAKLQNFAQRWVVDELNNPNSSISGKIQDNLGLAIAAGEALNDQQKEETRRYLFLFEEFYKSASAILTKLTELMQKMAQNINR